MPEEIKEEVVEEEKKKGPSTVNNALFVGSTADLAKMLKKPLDYNNINELREGIYKNIKSKNNNKIKEIDKINFVEENILIKPIDYYYTNAIARASKIMSECKQISKNITFKGIDFSNFLPPKGNPLGALSTSPGSI